MPTLAVTAEFAEVTTPTTLEAVTKLAVFAIEAKFDDIDAVAQLLVM